MNVIKDIVSERQAPKAPAAAPPAEREVKAAEGPKAPKAASPTEMRVKAQRSSFSNTFI